MSISYPINFPTSVTPSGLTIRQRSVVGVAQSPFSLSQQVYEHQGECWEVDVDMPIMTRAQASAFRGFLLSLNGRYGTFLLGDPVETTPLGTWSTGSPQVDGASQTGRSLLIKNLTAGMTIKAGDWFQLGSGSTTELHQVAVDATADGSGKATLDIWPRIRTSPANSAALVISSPKGRWRLADNANEYSVQIGQMYGFRFRAVEAL